jgi:hypothetical protein
MERKGAAKESLKQPSSVPDLVESTTNAGLNRNFVDWNQTLTKFEFTNEERVFLEKNGIKST